MKRHSSGISMWRWERILEHIKQGRKAVPRMYCREWRVEEEIIEEINNLPKNKGISDKYCPVDIFCGWCVYNGLDDNGVYGEKDAIWWRDLSPSTRKKIILALAKHFNV